MSANKTVQEGFERNGNLFSDPESFKFANITPAFKQGYRNFKDNYRPKRLMFKQLLNYSNIFSKFKCGFRKGFGTQHCLHLL